MQRRMDSALATRDNALSELLIVTLGIGCLALAAITSAFLSV